MKRFWTKLVLILILSASFFLMVASSQRDTQTTDEAIHLFSGYTYLKERDFRLDPEHPPFLKELAALPLLFIKPVYQLDDLWEGAGEFYYDSWQEARVLGEKFFYEWGNDAAKLLFWGRFPFIILTIILGLFVYHWAKKLYGEKAGILALILTLFSPSFLAHGRLINTDLGLALFIVLSVYFWGDFLKKPKWGNLLLTGVFVGLAFSSKYTAIILIPILILLAIIRMIINRKYPVWKYLGSFGVILILSWLLIWVSYFFSDRSLFLFPANFLKGIYFVFRHANIGHSSFLLGQSSNTGWWYYFPVVIFFKTPIPFFVFLALAIIYFKKTKAKDLPRGKAGIFDEYLILTPPIIFLLLSMSSKADLGIRHILPIFPFLFIFASRSINLIDLKKMKIATIGFVLLIFWYISAAFIFFPNYLSYFNEFAGGSRGGYRILTDSNLDWGQDILRIKEYLDQNNITDGYILYPWDGDAALKYYSINLTLLPWGEDKNLHGDVIVSATYLQQDELKWLWKYPYGQITPGVFIFHIS